MHEEAGRELCSSLQATAANAEPGSVRSPQGEVFGTMRTCREGNSRLPFCAKCALIHTQ
jgi:hypothetical protein